MSTIRSVPNRSFSRKSLETLDERLTELEENKTVANPELSGDEDALNSIEIDGVKYKVEGSGGGGSPTPVLYKHSLQLTFNVESSTQTCTVNFLSKYDTQFVNNGSLDNFVSNLLSLYQSQNDTNIYISPTIQIGSNFIMITQIYPDDDGLFFTLIVGQSTAIWGAYYEDNASGITDTVTPYIIAQGGGTGESTTITPELYTFTFGNLMAGPLFLYMTASQYNQLVQALIRAGYTISSPSDIENLYNNGTLLERLTGLGTINLFKMAGSADGYLLTGYEIDQNTGSITVNYFENDGTVNTSTWTAQNVSDSTLSIGYVSQTISGGGSSASTGGSGKLYDIKFNLSMYDNSGNDKDFVFQIGSDTSYQVNYGSTLPIELLIYESNFELLKQAFNQNTHLNVNITDINSLVSAINGIDESSYSATNTSFLLLYALISYCDKAYICPSEIGSQTLPSTPRIPIFCDDFFVMLGALYICYESSTNILRCELVDNDSVETSNLNYFNVNNSCTLTEYGTSGSGSTPTESSGVDYLQIYDINYHLTYTFEKGMLDKPELVQNTNELITTFNTQFSVNIPSYTGIDSLPTINSYITSLDSNYNSLKVIWYSSLFYSFNLYSISTVLNNYSPYRTIISTTPTIIARFDIQNQVFNYLVYALLPDIESADSPVIGSLIWQSGSYKPLSILVNQID